MKAILSRGSGSLWKSEGQQRAIKADQPYAPSWVAKKQNIVSLTIKTHLYLATMLFAGYFFIHGRVLIFLCIGIQSPPPCSRDLLHHIGPDAPLAIAPGDRLRRRGDDLAGVLRRVPRHLLRRLRDLPHGPVALVLRRRRRLRRPRAR